MTRSETKVVLSLIKSAYPNAYRDMTRADLESLVALWAEMFQDDPFEHVASAVKSIILTDENGFPPSIGQVKSRIRMLLSPTQLTETEAWDLVINAMRDSLYHAQQRFDAFPPQVKRAVGSPAVLRQWSMDDTYARSQFSRAFRDAMQQQEFIEQAQQVKINGLLGGQNVKGGLLTD